MSFVIRPRQVMNLGSCFRDDFGSMLVDVVLLRCCRVSSMERRRASKCSGTAGRLTNFSGNPADRPEFKGGG